MCGSLLITQLQLALLQRVQLALLQRVQLALLQRVQLMYSVPLCKSPHVHESKYGQGPDATRRHMHDVGAVVTILCERGVHCTNLVNQLN